MSANERIMAAYREAVAGKPQALPSKSKRKAPAAKRVGYREALDWIVQNDDIGFIRDNEENLSVTASMVRDLFDKTDEQVFADLRRALKKEGRL